MNIAIDTTPLTSGHSGRGVGVYTKYLIESLQKYEPKHSYTFFTRGQNIPKEADIVHYPYFDPFFLTLPLIKHKPTIVTVHDLIPLVYPEHFPPGIRGQIKWQIQKVSLMGAKRIISDSKASKKDIGKITGFNIDYIDVVYLAPAPVYKKNIEKSKTEAILKKYSIHKNYMIYVGDVNWNKNITTLLKAYALFKKAHSIDVPQLVLIGKSFVHDALSETQYINSMIKQLHIQKNIIKPGAINDEDLALLYGGAMCCIQPSYYEGFGLPVLEAMASGCPVIAADTSSLKEISGPALRVDPNASESLVVAMKEVFSFSNEHREEVIQKGIDWVKQFSWKKAAYETAQSYSKIHI